MSSISGSTERSRADELRNQREDYENREAEETKRHRKEIKRLSEKNDKDVEQLKENYEKQISDIRNRGNDAMTQRDQQNQAKIDQLRNMYLQQLREKNSDQDEKRQETNEATKNQLAKERVINEQQKDVLKTNLENELKERDRAYQDLSTRSRDEMKSSLQENQNRMIDAHHKEINSLVEDRDRQMQQKNREVQSAKASYTDRVKDMERQQNYQLEQMDNNWRQAYTNQEKQTAEMIKGNTEQLQIAQEHSRSRYDQALQKKLDELDDAHRTLKEQSQNRIETQLRGAQNENMRLKNQNLVAMMTEKRLRDLEKDHIVQNYEERYDRLNEQREGLIQSNLERTRENMQKANDNAEKLVADSDRRHREQQTLTKDQNDENLAHLKLTQQQELDHVSGRSEDRVQKLMKATGDAQRLEKKQHEANVGALKSAYSDHLAAQREVQMGQVSDLYVRMDKRVKDIQDRDAKALDTTVNNYEDKLSQTKDFYEGELKKQSDAFDKRLAQNAKARAVEDKSNEMKFDAKIAQLQVEHQKEMDRLEKRHQEQMSTLDSRLNYYRKKT